MGVIKQGILGAISGKVGSVVGSSWKGIAILKSMPASVSNPKTALQIAQRTKMTNVVAYSQTILSAVIKPLWDRFASKMSGYNDFVQTNISLFASVLPSIPASLIISKGKMVSVTPNSVTALNGGHTVTVNWDASLPDSYSQTTDEVYVVVSNETSKEIAYSAAVVTRAEESVPVSVDTALVTGSKLDIYLAFRRSDGTVVSNSGYLQKTVTAS